MNTRHFILNSVILLLAAHVGRASIILEDFDTPSAFWGTWLNPNATYTGPADLDIDGDNELRISFADAGYDVGLRRAFQASDRAGDPFLVQIQSTGTFSFYYENLASATVNLGVVLEYDYLGTWSEVGKISIPSGQSGTFSVNLLLNSAFTGIIDQWLSGLGTVLRFRILQQSLTAAGSDVVLDDFQLSGTPPAELTLLERALGIDPDDPSTGFTPTIGIVEMAGQSYPAYTYRRIAGGDGIAGFNYIADGIQYTVETDSDLSSPWGNGYLMVQGVGTPNARGYQEVTVRGTNPLSAQSPQFMRLEVSEPGADPAQPIPSLAEGGFAGTPSFLDFFNSGWKSSQTEWRIANFSQNGTEMSPDRVNVSASGILTETVLAGEPYRGGSIETWAEFGWGRWVARVRPSPVPGVLNSIFVKDWDDRTTPADGGDGNKAEIDIEFLTHSFGPGIGEVHLAVHFTDASPLFGVDIPLDFNPSDAFHEWGFDILPDRVVWHVDGEFLYEWIYTDTHAMTGDYEFFFNAWTRDTWILGPPATDAHYEIDWVRFYPLQ